MADKIRKKEGRISNELPCDICGFAVKLTDQRYVELVKAQELPRHAECARMFPRIRMKGKMIGTVSNPAYNIHWPQKKRGNRNGALPKFQITVDREYITAPVEDNNKK